MTPCKENAGIAGRRGMGTEAAPLGGGAKDSEFPRDIRGLPILNAAGLDVLRAWRYFTAEAGEFPAIVAALLVVAWAIRGGHHDRRP